MNYLWLCACVGEKKKWCNKQWSSWKLFFGRDESLSAVTVWRSESVIHLNDSVPQTAAFICDGVTVRAFLQVCRAKQVNRAHDQATGNDLETRVHVTCCLPWNKESRAGFARHEGEQMKDKHGILGRTATEWEWSVHQLIVRNRSKTSLIGAWITGPPHWSYRKWYDKNNESGSC